MLAEPPSGWAVERLGDVADWLSGGTPSTSEQRYWHGTIPWITSGSLTTFYLRTSERRLTDEGVSNGSRLIPENSIVFVVRGMSLKSEFRIGIARRSLAFGQDCKGLLAHAGVDPMFLAYAIRGRSTEVLSMVDEAGHGTGRLATDRIKSLRIFLPPVTEQRAIAEVLGALDDKIECNTLIAGLLERRLAELFTALNFDELKGDLVRLDELVELNPVRAKPRATVAPYIDMAALPTESALVAVPNTRPQSRGHGSSMATR